MKTFYICSYGGSGSTILCKALSKYGESVHIHSRFPPNQLEFVGVRTHMRNGLMGRLFQKTNSKIFRSFLFIKIR